MTPLSCAYCGCTDGPFEDDHVVPRSRGGPDEPRNLIKACKLCNREKRDKLPSEWLETVPAFVAAIEARVSASIGDKIRGKRDWKRKTCEAVTTCYFCGGAIASPAEGFLELFDQEIGPPFLSQTHTRFLANGGREERGALAYPGSGDHLVEIGKWRDYQVLAIHSHASCGPDNGYWISFEQLLDSGIAFWFDHLSDKRWMCLLYGDAIRLAHEAAKKLFRMRVIRAQQSARKGPPS